MKHLFENVMAATMVVVMGGALVGCEWGGGGDDNSWNDSASIANFTGNYQANGGYLVSDYSSSSGSSTGSSTTATTTGELNILNENKGNIPSPSFGGVCSQTPIKPGSVSFFISGGTSGNLRDNGSGALSGTISLGGVQFPATGSIDYGNGAYQINLNAIGNAVVGSALSVTYTIITGGGSGGGGTVTVGGNEPGSSSFSIYAFNVQQSGNKVKIIDNNGSVYEGSLGDVRTTGNLSSSTSGSGLVAGDQVIAPFSAAGRSKSGMHVNMAGNFQGTVAGVTSVTEASGSTTIVKTSFALVSRVIQGTWIEDGGQTGNINGLCPASANVSYSSSTSTNAP